MEIRYITTPFNDKLVSELKAGDKLLLSGYVYTARDVAHKRFMDAVNTGEKLPFNIKDQIIYYCGPSPIPPGKVIGACGPTTSSRMDLYTPKLLSLGLKGMIGKGKRSQTVREAIREYRAVYLGATGGAGALLSHSVISSDIVAYEDLGPEAVVRLTIKEMPLFVINDIYGNDLYEKGMKRYEK